MSQSSHWPGISFTVVLPGNNVLEQLTTSDSGKEIQQTQWNKHKLISLRTTLVTVWMCCLSALWLKQEHLSPFDSEQLTGTSRLDWYVEITVGYRNVSLLFKVATAICLQELHVSVGIGPSWEHRRTRGHQNLRKTLISADTARRCTNIVFSAGGEIPSSGKNFHDSSPDIFPSNTDQIKSH